MKICKRIFIVLFFVFAACEAPAAQYGMWETCLGKVAAAGPGGFIDVVAGYLERENDLEYAVDLNKVEITLALATAMDMECTPDEMLYIAKNIDKEVISFTRDGEEIDFDIDMSTLFAFLPAQVVIILSPDPRFKSTDVVKRDYLSKGQKFFQNTCSDHYIVQGVSPKSSVSIAGKKLFQHVGGDAHSYFLDFADGDNPRFFPGAILTSNAGNISNTIPVFNNLRVALKVAADFANELKGGPCQGLYVYVADINGQKYKPGSDKGGTTAFWGAISGTSYVVTAAASGVASSIVWGAAGGAAGGTAGKLALSQAMKLGINSFGRSLALRTGTQTAAAASKIIGTRVAGKVATAAAGKAATVAIPVIGWVITAGFLAYDAYQLLSPPNLGRVGELTIIAGPFLI